MGKQQNPLSVMCVCGGCTSLTAPTASDYQWKVGENITMVHLRVLLQDLDEKHSE